MAVTRRWKKRLALVTLLGVLLVSLWPQAALAAEMKAIHVYQRIGSPVVGLVVKCHYQPTCSHYAVQVLESDGFWMGNLETAKRLLLCSPLGLFLEWVNS